MSSSPSSLNDNELVPIVRVVANIVPGSLQPPDVHTKEEVACSQALLAWYDRCVGFSPLTPSIIDWNLLSMY